MKGCNPGFLFQTIDHKRIQSESISGLPSKYINETFFISDRKGLHVNKSFSIQKFVDYEFDPLTFADYIIDKLGYKKNKELILVIEMIDSFFTLLNYEIVIPIDENCKYNSKLSISVEILHGFYGI